MSYICIYIYIYIYTHIESSRADRDDPARARGLPQGAGPLAVPPEMFILSLLQLIVNTIYIYNYTNSYYAYFYHYYINY